MLYYLQLAKFLYIFSSKNGVGKSRKVHSIIAGLVPGFVVLLLDRSFFSCAIYKPFFINFKYKLTNTRYLQVRTQLTGEILKRCKFQVIEAHCPGNIPKFADRTFCYHNSCEHHSAHLRHKGSARGNVRSTESKVRYCFMIKTF